MWRLRERLFSHHLCWRHVRYTGGGLWRMFLRVNKCLFICGVTSSHLGSGVPSRHLGSGVTSSHLGSGVTSSHLGSGVTSSHLSSGVTSSHLSSGG